MMSSSEPSDFESEGEEYTYGNGRRDWRNSMEDDGLVGESESEDEPDWDWPRRVGTEDAYEELLDIDFLRVRKLRRATPRERSPTPPLPPPRILGGVIEGPIDP